MKSFIQKSRQSSVIFKKPDILFENLRTFMSSNYPTVNIFCWNFAHVSYLSTSSAWDFFILFKSWFIFKNQKRSGFKTLAFCIFINNSRSKQKINPEQAFLDIIK